ncbi:tetratricopeptide repeat protein [Micromonospora sp. WMMD998]|uniref:tetratricopeptide repeat protein n=1 Tax=Micromonospora sp. WMMD998 TaxID=3016092 RepID=UPI00249BC6F1|nr:tetratricopeptide repeat protein [Micromonospora sp. WMMD998]WFE39215.1 tetratricopeptide repeat protein [Micromonospora sp. WMMD998]
MSSGFADLTVQAHHLVSEGDLTGAQQLLADALSDADPRPGNASPELAEAAGLQARLLVALGEPHSARGWAAFAYAAATRLFGRSDERTVTAAATLAAVLHRVGSDARAARLYSDVIIELTARDGPESQRVLAAHADLATVEYARGQCDVARDRLQDAWELHREVYGDGHASGIKMLAKLGAMERDCGRYDDAHEHLTLAEDLCRQHLAVDDPLAVQVAGLARAAADPDHACAAPPEPPARETPVVPAARVPSSAEGVPDLPPYAPPALDDPVETPLYHPPGRAADTAHVPTPRTPPEADDDPYDDYPWPPDEPAEQPWRPDEPAEQPWRPDEPADQPWRSGEPADQPWRPSEPAERSWRPGEDALPPTVAGLADDAPPGVRRVPPPPESPSRYLPVHVPRPPVPPRRERPWLPLAVLGVVVALLLGTIAVIAGVSKVGSRDAPVTSPTGPSAGPSSRPPASTRPTASAPPAARPGTPPGRFTLTDRRDSIVLSWTYPRGAEGPVVVAGGRAGQPQGTFATLPAGSGDYIAYGLDRTTDYCFTVALVWSTDTVARTGPVCTKRRR